MEEKFAILRRGPHYNATSGHGYNTLKQAADDGAVVMAYGYVLPLIQTFGCTNNFRTFLNKVFNFLGVGLALYLVASVYEWMSTDTIIKHTVKCKYCRKTISSKAHRCVNCTSWLDGREDKVRTE